MKDTWLFLTYGVFAYFLGLAIGMFMGWAVWGS